MDMQNVSNLQIPEGAVRAIHDKDNRLVWGRLNYDTKYAGDTLQNGTPTPDVPIPVNVVTGAQTVTISDGGGNTQTLPINLTSKNLFYIKDATGTRGNNTVVASNQTITVNSNTNGTETAFYLNDCSYISQWAPSQWQNARDFNMTGLGGDYVVKMYYQNLPTGTATMHTYVFTNKRQIMKPRTEIVDGVLTFSISLDDDEYIKSALIYTAASNVFNNFTVKVQLEQGSIATSYEPYYNYELCKISTYQDYIYKSGDGWYVHKATKKVMFNGTEVWDKPQPDNVFRLPGSYSDMVGAAVAGAAISDFFVFWPNSGGILNNLPNGQFGLVGTLANINFRYDTTTTISAWKTWLTNHNVSVYYALATPTETQITDTTLIGQLNAVHEWLTRYGYNATVTGNLPIIISKTNI